VQVSSTVEVEQVQPETEQMAGVAPRSRVGASVPAVFSRVVPPTDSSHAPVAG